MTNKPDFEPARQIGTESHWLPSHEILEAIRECVTTDARKAFAWDVSSKIYDLVEKHGKAKP